MLLARQQEAGGGILAAAVATKEGGRAVRHFDHEKEGQLEKLQRLRQGLFGVLFVMSKNAGFKKTFFVFMLGLSWYQVRRSLTVLLSCVAVDPCGTGAPPLYKFVTCTLCADMQPCQGLRHPGVCRRVAVMSTFESRPFVGCRSHLQAARAVTP